MEIFEHVLDSLPHQVALLNEDGAILWVNRAWVQFGTENDGPEQTPWQGVVYLSACVPTPDPETDGAAAASGIASVLSASKTGFELEYACHSPTVRRWFLMTVRQLEGVTPRRVVVMHLNITRRREAEIAAHRLAMRDGLTGLANRRTLDEFLRRAWNRARRLGTPLAMLMIDVDHFKSYNDTLGHVAGDQCLRRLAGRIASFARRPEDLAARYGGEEFALVLGGTDVDGAQVVAEELRAAIELLEIEHLSQANARLITVSVGVAAYWPNRAEADHTVLVRLADRALYAAKEAGRNRVFAHHAGRDPRPI